jgi:hypothetical protein
VGEAPCLKQNGDIYLYFGFALYFGFRRFGFWVLWVFLGRFFGGLLGWGALGEDLDVFEEGFDGGFHCFLGFEFHVGFGCYGCFLAGRA